METQLDGLTDFQIRKMAEVSGVLELLQDGMLFSRDAKLCPWEFATKLEEIRALLPSENELRWMFRSGWIRHGIESTQVGDADRSIAESESCVFSDESCFILSDCGSEIATAQLETANLQTDASPQWDSVRHELRFRNQVVKQFRWPAANQVALLAAFEEEHWPSRIDDPLPPVLNQDSKRRLADTIKCLNRNQRKPIIRFHGDGTGEGVRWVLRSA